MYKACEEFNKCSERQPISLSLSQLVCPISWSLPYFCFTSRKHHRFCIFLKLVHHYLCGITFLLLIDHQLSHNLHSISKTLFFLPISNLPKLLVFFSPDSKRRMIPHTCIFLVALFFISLTSFVGAASFLNLSLPHQHPNPEFVVQEVQRYKQIKFCYISSKNTKIPSVYLFI